MTKPLTTKVTTPKLVTQGAYVGVLQPARAFFKHWTVNHAPLNPALLAERIGQLPAPGKAFTPPPMNGLGLYRRRLLVRMLRHIYDLTLQLPHSDAPLTFVTVLPTLVPAPFFLLIAEGNNDILIHHITFATTPQQAIDAIAGRSLAPP